MQMSRPRSPANRWLRRTGHLLVIVVFVGLALKLYFDRNDRQERQAWQAACAEADGLDPGWRWEDLSAPPNIPDEKNSLFHARSAARLMGSPAASAQIEHAVSGLQRERRPPKELVIHLREHMASVTPSLAAADRMASCAEGQTVLPQSPLILAGSWGPYAMEFLLVAKRLLYPRLVLQVEDGDADAALASVRSIIAMSRPLAETPRMMDALVASAMRAIAANGVERVIAHGQPSSAALKVTRQLLEIETRRPVLLAGFRGERSFVEDTVRALDDGRLQQSNLPQPGPFTNSVIPLTGWRWADSRVKRLFGEHFSRGNATALLRYYTWLIEQSKKSHGNGLQYASARVYLVQMPRVVRSTADTMTRYATDGQREEARFRCAVAALAAEEYRQATGRWPATLATGVFELGSIWRV